MAKKKKNKRRGMPELGWQDRALYFTLIIALLAMAVLALFYHEYYLEQLVSANENVIGYAGGEGRANFLWLMAFLCLCSLIVFAFYQSKYPIIGRSDIRYGYPKYSSVYPLLMKNKPNASKNPKVRARQKKTIGTILGIMVLMFAISVLLYSRSLAGRYELHRDGTVVVYDADNQQTAHYGIGDMESVCLDVYSHAPGRGGIRRYSVLMRFSFSDDDSCFFSVGGLGESWEESMEIAMALKARYGDLIRIEGREDLHKVAWSRDLDPRQTQLMYQLFDEEIPAQ